MSKQATVSQKKQSFRALKQRKAKQGKPFTMLTAYDYSMAKTLDAAAVEMLLVGDSLAMTILGHKDTLSVTLDEMLHHAKAVVRGTQQALVVADAPFMSYHVSVEDTLRNVSRFIREAGADAVKLEGASELILDSIERLVEVGIPVVGHLGFTPQAVKEMGGFRVQGKDAGSALGILEAALNLESVGVSALVLEMIPAPLAKLISSRLSIPVIGIGAGPDCDGQVLVIDDLIGRYPDLQPRFVRRYMQASDLITEAVQRFQSDVAEKSFPSLEHESFSMAEEEWERFQQTLERLDGASADGAVELSDLLLSDSPN